MAGSISLSLSQQFDELGEPLNGGLLYFFAAGTTTPQSAYIDVALTLPYPNPIVLDSAGRVPPFYLADGQIKIRLANAAGVTQVAADNLLVIGASSGSGSPPTVDPTTVLQPGWLQAIYGTGVVTGFVRANGRTIGNAASGASERANADTVLLFTFLYEQDTNLAVSGGRGANAAADYAANKTIALPDWRGRALAFLDDMGNSPAGRLTSTYFGTSAIALGAAGGAESQTLTRAQLPTGITVAGTVTVATPGGEDYPTVASTNWGGPFSVASPGAISVPVANAPVNNRNTMTGSNTLTSNNTSGNAHPIVMPTMLATVYIKL